ncbi:hypothetical protein [Xanthobacter autotrophicus]|uniref:hypothetical protein n=1 Tax=Xanthobacter autotrophicus TaxID=280 RepID=UPI00372A77D2
MKRIRYIKNAIKAHVFIIFIFISFYGTSTERANGDSEMQNKITEIFESINNNIDNLQWNSFSIDVSDYFVGKFDGYKFSEILRDFAVLSGRQPIPFIESRWEINKIYYFGLEPPILANIAIKNNKFKRSWDFLISAKYVGDNSFILLTAKIVDKKSWP